MTTREKKFLEAVKATSESNHSSSARRGPKTKRMTDILGERGSFQASRSFSRPQSQSQKRSHRRVASISGSKLMPRTTGIIWTRKMVHYSHTRHNEKRRHTRTC